MKKFLLLSLSFLALTTSAQSGDHPFVGVYYFGNPDGPYRPAYSLEQERLNCAYTFAILYASGAFSDYVLDKAEYDKSGKVRYQYWTKGSCDISSDRKYDTCQTATAPQINDKVEMGNVYGDLTSERVDFSLYESGKLAAAAAASGDTKSGLAMHAMRCPFTIEQVQPYLVDEMSPLESKPRARLVSPDTSPETIDKLKAVLKAMNVNMP